MAVDFANGDLITARLNFAADGKPDRAMNVLHYKVDELTGAPFNLTAGLTAIGNEVYDFFKALWAQAASENVSLNNVTVTNVFPLPRSVSVTTSTDAGTPGDIVSQPLPLQDAPTILKKTDIGARWGLGRLFFVGTPESHQDGGILSGPGLAALEAFVLGVKTDIEVTGVGFSCKLKPVLKRGPEDDPTSLTPIRNAVMSDAIIKTQRRRRPGKGD